MTNIIFKLMVLGAMSFFVSSQGSSAFASDEVKKDSEEEKVLSSAKREIHKHAIGIGLGQTFLFGDFEDNGDNKITADLLYSYTASFSFDLLINAHFSHHSHKDGNVFLRGYAMSIKGRSYEFDAFSPFILGGVGFYLPQIEQDGKTSDAKYTFGFNVGGGADLQLNDKVVIGLLGQYHKPFEIKQDDVNDVSGSYFKMLLTCMYLF